MRKRIAILVIASLILLSGCEYIPQYKFTTGIPASLLEAQYGKYFESSRELLYMDLSLDANGSFVYSGYGESYEDFLPAKGVYTVQYSSYDVLSASGSIRFTATDGTGKVASGTFIWLASAENGIESIQIELSDGRRNTLEWLGPSQV